MSKIISNITEDELIERMHYKNVFYNYMVTSLDESVNDNNMIYISNSNTHGIGIFANKNINKDELITFYPAHYITITNSKPFIIRLTELKLDKQIYNDYTIIYDNGINITGSPLLNHNKHFIGHLCNDGYKHNYKNNTKKNRNSYNKKTKEYNNASTRIITDHELSNTNLLGIISTKNIIKNEEIKISYGFKYWLKRNLN